MSTRVSLLLVTLAIVLLPWLLWRVRAVRRVAPLAVVQIVVGVVLGPSGFGQIVPGLHAALFTRPVLGALDGVSTVGVLLYVFITGLHRDGAALRREGRSLGMIAAGSVCVPLLLGLGAGAWMLGAVAGALGPSGSVAGFVVAAGICTRASGVSEALGTGYLIGAFVAGAIMPAACRPALLARLELVTATVLLPFFFMSTELKALIEPGSASFLGLVSVLVLATVLGKLIGTAWPARRAGFSWAESLSLGAMMQTKGLMEVVVLGVLHEAGLIGLPVFSGMVAMAVVCTVITAPAVRLFGGRMLSIDHVLT